MDITRYITIQAIKTRNNEIIPLWDNRLKFEKTEMYGNQITFSETYEKFFNTIEAIYDLKTKSISTGVEVDIYPEKNTYPFEINEEVMYEVSHKKLTKVSIVDIIFENYDIRIMKGKNIDAWYKKQISIEIEPNTLYSLKIWKMTFVLSNDKKTEWEHQLFKIV